MPAKSRCRFVQLDICLLSSTSLDPNIQAAHHMQKQGKKASPPTMKATILTVTATTIISTTAKNTTTFSFSPFVLHFFCCKAIVCLQFLTIGALIRAAILSLSLFSGWKIEFERLLRLLLLLTKVYLAFFHTSLYPRSSYRSWANKKSFKRSSIAEALLRKKDCCCFCSRLLRYKWSEELNKV